MLNFLNKNKKQEEKVEEKPEEKVEKNPHLANVWNKEEFIEQKFANRPIEFYIRNYRININIA